MNRLQVGMVGFDITPRFHPTCGAWGCTPTMTELDMPLSARCIAFEWDGRKLLWFGSDLVGETVAGTDAMRADVASALDLKPHQIVWSTSQTHSSGAIPGSVLTGSSICDLSLQDPNFMASERERLMGSYISAAREALRSLQPARVWAGRGYCDSMSYNTRFPMPNGGVKFSRHHGEGLQSGKPFDTTIGLVRFENDAGATIGAIFNFCAHPATMINDRMISPDWVGTARAIIEEQLGGAPAMFCQGFCGDVNCYHIFGTPQQARRTGARLGQAAAEALPHLMPVRAEPFDALFETIDLQCRPMFSQAELEADLAARLTFVEELDIDPAATWFCGINTPEQLDVEQKKAFVGVQIDYQREGLRMLAAGEKVRTTLPFTIGALRFGDVAAVLSPGENFTATGMRIRDRSPFAHTLICGDTNGLFGYLGDDAEIDRGGYETDSYWRMLYVDGFRLAPAKGTVDRIIDCSLRLLNRLQSDA